MSLFSRGIVAAMEDEMANQELAIDEAGADSMEADLVETVDLAADIDAGTNEMEQTVKDVDQLERHVEVLTDAEGEGGASPELIEATEIAVEGIYNRLGIYGDTGIPALESFSTKSGRRRYTAEAIDGIKNKIKGIWEAVVSAFKKLVNYVKDFFSKLFDANKKMLSRIIALRVKAKSIKGVAKDKIKGSGIVNVLGANPNQIRLGGVSVADGMKQAEKTLELTQSFVDGVNNQASFEKASLSNFGSGADAKASAPDKMTWKVIFELAGNKIIHCVPKESPKGKEAYELAAKYSVKTEKGDSKSDGEIEVLTTQQITEMLNTTEAIVKQLMDQKQSIAKVQSEMDKTINTINSIAAQASKEDDDVGKRSVQARSAVTALGNGGIKVITMVGSETTRSCQAMLTYVERSIDAYSEDNDKDKK